MILTFAVIFITIIYSFATLSILNKWVDVKFVDKDLWIGCYIKTDKKYVSGSILSHGKQVFKKEYTFYICLIPTLPIIIKIRK